jgi:hypothetical protein
MNGWYGATIAGVVLLIEGLVNLITNKIKKQESLSDAIRASSGGCVLILAYLSIHFKWLGAGIAVSYNPLYSLSFAGFVLVLESFFSFLINAFKKRKREAGIDSRRAYIGIGIFLAGLIALFVSGG